MRFDMTYTEKFEKWKSASFISDKLKNELNAITDDNEIKLRFLKDISFGTAGLRGILGPGSNCLNEVTVSWITKGVADMIKSYGYENRGVVVGRDSRNMSDEFSRLTACVLAFNGIKVYYFDDIRPTAEVSFAVREYSAAAGVNITASHNPKKYNGYKLYWEDGAQISPEVAKKVLSFAGDEILCRVDAADFEDAVKSGMIKLIGSETDERYLGEVNDSIGDTFDFNNELTVVYTPIHGSGYKLVPELLRRRGHNLYCVDEQMTPNGDFPTCDPPNPERKEAYTYALKKAGEVDADIILATDPDADRQGALVKHNGEYIMLTGNQIGVFLCDYRLKNYTGDKKPYVVKSLVSTDMVRPMCEDRGADLYTVLTGFKFIGEQIALHDDEKNKFIFGFEESFGYLGKGYARDKDAVFASNCFAQAAAIMKKEGKTVIDRLNELYLQYGGYSEKTVGFDLDPISGSEKVVKIMKELASDIPESICGMKVEKLTDYSKGVNGLPKSDIVEFTLSGGTKLIIRPSGTEPKVKIYALCRCETKDKADALAPEIISAGAKLLNL